MKFLLPFLLFVQSWGVIRTHQELIDLVGRKGDITHLYDLYTRTMPDTAWSVESYGLRFRGINPADVHGMDGLRLSPHLRGATHYYSTLAIYPPIIDSGASTGHLTGIDMMDMVGGDSSNYAIRTRKGHVVIGDTLTATRLFREGGGRQVHVSLIRVGRRIAADTDHVLIGYPNGAPLRDTLPRMDAGLGQEYLFYLYHQATDSAWIIYPDPGDSSATIDGYDSIVLKSNLGIARLRLFGEGDRWRVMEHHEEGYFYASMSDVIGPATSIGYYYLDNLLNVVVRIKPIAGVSNTTATTFDLTGLNQNFTDLTLDSTWTASAAPIGVDSSQAVSLRCVMFMSGVVRCWKDDFTAFAGNHVKGIPYGLEFYGRLPQPARHE